MMDFIERLRTKPPEVKSRYAFLIAVLFTAIAVFVWVLSLPARFSGDTRNTSVISEQGSENAFNDFFNEGKQTVETVIENATRGDVVEQPVPVVTEGLEANSTTTTPSVTTHAELLKSKPSTENPVTSGSSSPRVIQIATTSIQKNE